MKNDVSIAKSKLIIGLIFWVVMIAGLISLVSCGSTRKKTEITDISKITDTIVHKKIIVSKDSLIVIPGTTLKVSVPAAQLDNGQPVETTTDRGRVILQKSGENIEAVCVIDDLVKVIQLQQTVIENYQKIASEQTKTEKTESVKIPWYDRLFAWLSIAVLIYMILLWTFRKKTTT
ncbi:hypothetical protein [Flavobacterium cerinum]|uniref:Uncharacterized protein n=1 Tax=Flavobacterium cerinum TaxID=2502784 RepID=A0ABY5IW71_9FLAO|nr:hypothetical protein [Flavobacterium cerinum]UUC45589.1 hypothetical protein NOX80_18455 [Flavobacterium cerinum]